MQIASISRALALAISLSLPQASFNAGILHVDRFGHGPQKLVVIPALGYGAWGWAGTIDRFSDDYTLYVVTLPGFD